MEAVVASAEEEDFLAVGAVVAIPVVSGVEVTAVVQALALALVAVQDPHRSTEVQHSQPMALALG